MMNIIENLKKGQNLTFEESKSVAKQGGKVAKDARESLEAKTGKKVISSLNAKDSLPKSKKITE